MEKLESWTFFRRFPMIMGDEGEDDVVVGGCEGLLMVMEGTQRLLMVMEWTQAMVMALKSLIKEMNLQYLLMENEERS